MGALVVGAFPAALLNVLKHREISRCGGRVCAVPVGDGAPPGDAAFGFANVAPEVGSALVDVTLPRLSDGKNALAHARLWWQ